MNFLRFLSWLQHKIHTDLIPLVKQCPTDKSADADHSNIQSLDLLIPSWSISNRREPVPAWSRFIIINNVLFQTSFKDFCPAEWLYPYVSASQVSIKMLLGPKLESYLFFCPICLASPEKAGRPLQYMHSLWFNPKKPQTTKWTAWFFVGYSKGLNLYQNLLFLFQPERVIRYAFYDEDYVLLWLGD